MFSIQFSFIFGQYIILLSHNNSYYTTHQTTQRDTTPHHTTHQTTQRDTTPHHTTLHHTKHQTTQHDTTPHPTTLHHTTPHHITPRHTTPHHTKPHHTTTIKVIVMTSHRKKNHVVVRMERIPGAIQSSQGEGRMVGFFEAWLEYFIKMLDRIRLD